MAGAKKKPTRPRSLVIKPAARPLRVYAFDPSQGRLLGNEMTLAVRNHPLLPGPTMVPSSDHDGIVVVDYDGSRDTYYTPVNLDDPNILMQGGLPPSESNPHFHQQMVYAVARETIERFEAALGRRIHWRRAEREPGGPPQWHADDILTLQLFPHAMRAANAFYSPDAHGILFGYFSADRNDPGRNLPGQPVFTCLSHDIVAHETTHAIIDGIRSHFIEQTNIDVPAFHEAFADLTALFRHFSHEEVLFDTVQRTGGRLYDFQLRPDAATDAVDAPPAGKAGANGLVAPLLSSQIAGANPLIELALQFGQASGLRSGLRSALGTPATPDALKRLTEPHARGAVLVAAVFDAFFTTYVKRTAALFRVFRAGGGVIGGGELPESLAHLLCQVASSTADEFFRRCARAIDYCPPVDITFGDFLRALITADIDFGMGDDPDGVRDSLMQAFRMRGIVARGARFFSEGALCWPTGEAFDLPNVPGIQFGDANAFTKPHRDATGIALRAYANERSIRDRLGLDPKLEVRVPSFHPVLRAQRDGTMRTDMVVEFVQTRRETANGREFPFRSGYTLILTHARDAKQDSAAFVRYAIGTPGGDHPKSKRRLERQKAFAEKMGLLQGDQTNPFRIDFSLIHGGM
jgi:hypothetical protein